MATHTLRPCVASTLLAGTLAACASDPADSLAAKSKSTGYAAEHHLIWYDLRHAASPAWRDDYLDQLKVSINGPLFEQRYNAWMIEQADTLLRRGFTTAHLIADDGTLGPDRQPTTAESSIKDWLQNDLWAVDKPQEGSVLWLLMRGPSDADGNLLYDDGSTLRADDFLRFMVAQPYVRNKHLVVVWATEYANKLLLNATPDRGSPNTPNGPIARLINELVPDVPPSDTPLSVVFLSAGKTDLGDATVGHGMASLGELVSSLATGGIAESAINIVGRMDGADRATIGTSGAREGGAAYARTYDADAASFERALLPPRPSLNSTFYALIDAELADKSQVETGALEGYCDPDRMGFVYRDEPFVRQVRATELPRPKLTALQGKLAHTLQLSSFILTKDDIDPTCFTPHRWSLTMRRDQRTPVVFPEEEAAPASGTSNGPSWWPSNWFRRNR